MLMRMGLSFHSLCTLTVSVLNRCPGRILTRLGPDVNSNFVEVSVVLFVTDVPGIDSDRIRSLLPIYLDTFFSLPLTRADGTKLGFEDVVRLLDAETLSYSIDINSPLQEGITLKIKVAKDKYSVAVAWLSDLLYSSSFAVDRCVRVPRFRDPSG